MAIDAGVIGVVGAALGAGAVLASQQLNVRAQKKRDRAVLFSDALRVFLRATQEMERVAGKGDATGEERARAASEMWAAHKYLRVFTSSRFRDALDAYANEVSSTIWNGPPDGVAAWEHLRGPMRLFGQALEVEQKALGFQA